MNTKKPNKPIALLVAEVKAQAANAQPIAKSEALARIDALVACLRTHSLEATTSLGRRPPGSIVRIHH
ncbi:MAG: hypothetical protein ACNJA3_28585 (plasmid) [Pseudomonas rhizophila]|uniref:hypothetical protein n=1 Tax=Pseudomonas rhizophila TaxID=2045200 RepID=UPI003F6B46B3